MTDLWEECQTKVHLLLSRFVRLFIYLFLFHIPFRKSFHYVYYGRVWLRRLVTGPSPRMPVFDPR
jgi:hypothetical protein